MKNFSAYQIVDNYSFEKITFISLAKLDKDPG
jgi:hypothetical protein